MHHALLHAASGLCMNNLAEESILSMAAPTIACAREGHVGEACDGQAAAAAHAGAPVCEVRHVRREARQLRPHKRSSERPKH